MLFEDEPENNDLPDLSEIFSLLEKPNIEIQTFCQFQDHLQKTIPEITLKKEDVYLLLEEDYYEIGDFEGHCFVENYHVLDFKIFAGMEEGKDVQYVKIIPINEQAFKENYTQALEDMEEHTPFDVLKIDMYQGIQNLTSNLNIQMIKSISKYDAVNWKDDSVEQLTYEEAIENNINYLDQPLHSQCYILKLDFKAIETKQEASLAALNDFVSEFKNIEPQYDRVLAKHGAQNIYSL